MNIETEKIRLTKQLLNTDDPKVLAIIKTILEQESGPDFWDDLTTFQREEIQEASREIENGDYRDFGEVLEKYRE